MTEDAIIDAWIYKFCLSEGKVLKVRAQELADDSGRIVVIRGPLRYQTFDKDDWARSAPLAIAAASKRVNYIIATNEARNEKLKTFVFDADHIDDFSEAVPNNFKHAAE